MDCRPIYSNTVVKYWKEEYASNSLQNMVEENHTGPYKNVLTPIHKERKPIICGARLLNIAYKVLLGVLCKD